MQPEKFTIVILFHIQTTNNGQVTQKTNLTPWDFSSTTVVLGFVIAHGIVMCESFFGMKTVFPKDVDVNNCGPGIKM